MSRVNTCALEWNLGFGRRWKCPLSVSAFRSYACLKHWFHTWNNCGEESSLSTDAVDESGWTKRGHVRPQDSRVVIR